MKEDPISLHLPVLNPRKFEYYRYAYEWTSGELKRKALLTDEGLQKIRQGRPIAMEKARKVAAAFGVPLLEILDPRQQLQLMAEPAPDASGEGLPDWSTVHPLSGTVTRSNGLTYWVWKLEHVTETDRLGRGKRYAFDPGCMSAEEQRRMSTYLARHGNVCNRLARHACFPRHVSTVPAPDGKSWWSVDDWTEGTVLAELIYCDAIPPKAKALLMRNIAKGLRALHEEGVIYRELSTEHVLVTDVGQGTVVLTDFELGKMLDGSPTVRGGFPPNPYQPKEIDGKTLTEDDTHVDWYSWARILIHVVTGGLPPKNQEGSCLEQTELSDRVKKIVAKCLSPDPSARPREAKEVLGGIRWWR